MCCYFDYTEAGKPRIAIVDTGCESEHRRFQEFYARKGIAEILDKDLPPKFSWWKLRERRVENGVLIRIMTPDGQ